MGQKSGSVKEPAKQVVKEIRRATRRRSNRKNTSPTALPLSGAAWIMLKEVMPSGRTPHSSPSRYAWSAPSDATTAAITSSRGRCGSVDARRDRGVHACGSRQILISYSHSGPSGVLLAGAGSVAAGKATAVRRAAEWALWDYRTCSTARLPAGSGRSNSGSGRVRSSQASQSERSRMTICRS
jgi:hypothetical protein